MFGIELNAVVNQQRTQKVRTFETEMIEQTFVISIDISLNLHTKNLKDTVGLNTFALSNECISSRFHNKKYGRHF
jgi:hypothetical protein